MRKVGLQTDTILDQRNRKAEERKKIVLIGKLTRKLYKKSLNILEYKVTKSRGRKVKLLA